MTHHLLSKGSDCCGSSGNRQVATDLRGLCSDSAAAAGCSVGVAVRASMLVVAADSQVKAWLLGVDCVDVGVRGAHGLSVVAGPASHRTRRGKVALATGWVEGAKVAPPSRACEVTSHVRRPNPILDRGRGPRRR